MILGIGTDLVEVARMEAALARHGRRFAERILTEPELAGFDDDASPAHFLARRFAAKEACAKAFGTGFRDGLSLRHIGVDHDALGRPLLALTGEAAIRAARLGVGASHLSLSDDRAYALAFVVLEGQS